MAHQGRSGRRSTWEGSSTQGGMRWLIRDAQYGALRTALHLGRIVNPGWNEMAHQGRSVRRAQDGAPPGKGRRPRVAAWAQRRSNASSRHAVTIVKGPSGPSRHGSPRT